MNRIEAENIIAKHQYLLDTIHKGQLISMLLVVPANHAELSEIAWNTAHDESNDSILDEYGDFDVAVIFDWDQYILNGCLMKTSLSALLAELKTNV